MSRSRKKTPIFKNAGCNSEKQDKRLANRRFRRRTNQNLIVERFERIPIDIREVSNVWSFSGDGRHYWSHGNSFYGDGQGLLLAEALILWDKSMRK